MAIPALSAYIGQVGPQVQSDGTTPALRLGRSAELVTDELHGRYYETTYRKNMYSFSATGLTTTLGTTLNPYAGLLLLNPATSGINVVVNKFGLACPGILANATAFGLMTGYNFTGTTVATTTAGTAIGQFVGQTAGQALVYTAFNSTTYTAVVTKFLASGFTANTNIQTITPATYFDLEGSVILPPGAFIASYTSNISPAAFAASISWEEVLP